MNIEFRILEDEEKKLKTIKKEDFEEEYHEIEGQFFIKMGEYTLGYVDKDIPVGNELLVTWFGNLVQSAIYLKKFGYAIFNVIDLDNVWIEFNVKYDSIILVSEKKSTIPNVNFLISNKKEEFFKNSKKMERTNIQINSVSFYEEIMLKTKFFLEKVNKISNVLMETEGINELKIKLEYLSSL